MSLTSDNLRRLESYQLGQAVQSRPGLGSQLSQG